MAFNDQIAANVAAGRHTEITVYPDGSILVESADPNNRDTSGKLVDHKRAVLPPSRDPAAAIAKELAR